MKARINQTRPIKSHIVVQKSDDSSLKMSDGGREGEKRTDSGDI